MYSINPAAFSGIFALPKSVTDEHLRHAGEVQLKVLLLIFRNPENKIDENSLSAALGTVSPEGVREALDYWVSNGILLRDCAPASPGTDNAPVNDGQKNALDLINTPTAYDAASSVTVRPSQEQVALRLEESEELRVLFNSVQLILGKQVGYDGQCVLLRLVDSEGLPCEVVRIICEYAKKVGKTSFRYVEKTGIEWSKKGIDTPEAAQKRVDNVGTVEQAWDTLRVGIGAENLKPTANQNDYIYKWICEYGFSNEMILAAYEQNVELKGKYNLKYMDKILSDWREKGYTTIADTIKPEEHQKEQSPDGSGSAPKDGDGEQIRRIKVPKVIYKY